MPARSDPNGWRWTLGDLVDGRVTKSKASNDRSIELLCLAFSHGTLQEYDCDEKFSFVCQAYGELFSQVWLTTESNYACASPI